MYLHPSVFYALFITDKTSLLKAGMYVWNFRSLQHSIEVCSSYCLMLVKLLILLCNTFLECYFVIFTNRLCVYMYLYPMPALGSKNVPIRHKWHLNRAMSILCQILFLFLLPVSMPMLAEHDTVFKYQFCLCVCRMLVLCQHEWTYHYTFWTLW